MAIVTFNQAAAMNSFTTGMAPLTGYSFQYLFGVSRESTDFDVGILGTFDGQPTPNGVATHIFYDSSDPGYTADMEVSGISFAINATTAGYVLTGNFYQLFTEVLGGGDQIHGTWAEDTLAGFAGDDVLIGGDGPDQLNGGAPISISNDGADTASYQTAATGVIASLTSPSGNTGDAAGDTYTSIENLTGSNFADTLRGDTGINVLTGSGGNDLLFGLAGNDRLIGGLGRDTLAGGDGRDTFVFAAKTHSVAGANADRITDFDDKGDDRIDLSALFGPVMAYVHTGAFTKAGQVRINDVAGPSLIVEVNTGGSLAADFAIVLTATTIGQITKGDFIL